MRVAQNLKGQNREDALLAFFDCKALMMTHYQNLHGGSPQRDISYLVALQRLLTIDLGNPPEQLKTFGLKSCKGFEFGEKVWPPSSKFKGAETPHQKGFRL